MKIADIEVINLLYWYPDKRGFTYAGGVASGRLTTLVRVTTEGGQTGWGSAYGHPDINRIIIEHQLKPILLGADPRETESLWTLMYNTTRWYGRKGAAMTALGALDTAMWDLRGKAAGKPVAEILGPYRSDVPAYASGLLWKDDPDELGSEAAGYAEQGYRRVKMRLARSEEYDIAAVLSVRKAVGPSIDIMVDGSMRYPMEAAERMARFFEQQGVFWFEEPFAPEDIDSFVQLRSRVSIPLAAGENEFGVQGFRELLRAGAIDIAQPDVSRAGGISECFRIGQLAAKSGIRVATHSWSDAIAIVGNMHLIAALPTGITVEIDRSGNPMVDELLIEPLQVKDGVLHLSQAPGLGIDINEKLVEQLRLPAHMPVPEGCFSDLFFGKAYLHEAQPYQMSEA
jgi:L-alanine-DL-glutamate epimerase-like enolase superfamily enzyme